VRLAEWRHRLDEVWRNTKENRNERAVIDQKNVKTMYTRTKFNVHTDIPFAKCQNQTMNEAVTCIKCAGEQHAWWKR
jgi:hypothetical protein